MKRGMLYMIVLTGLLAAGLMLGCGGEKPRPNEPQPPKISLPFEKVRMEQGAELSVAKLNNVDKIFITETFFRTGSLTKMGDVIYIRNANTKTISEARIDGEDLKITKADVVKDIPEDSFISNDGKNLIYRNANRHIDALAADGTVVPFFEQRVTGMVGVPGKPEVVSFASSAAVIRYEVTDGKVGSEMNVVIPKDRDKLLQTPNGIACDGTNVYMYGSTLDGKMTVGAVAVYSLDGIRQHVIGNKHDEARKPGYLASAFDLAVTEDYLFVFDGNIRRIHIFNKKDGSIVDFMSADTLFDGQTGVHLMAMEDNAVLAVVKPDSKNEFDAGDKVFVLKMGES